MPRSSQEASSNHESQEAMNRVARSQYRRAHTRVSTADERRRSMSDDRCQHVGHGRGWGWGVEGGRVPWPMRAALGQCTPPEALENA
eukprot:900180-Prymnesium_polylepis.1